MPKPMSPIGKIEEVWFKGYESVSLEPFAWIQLCVLPSGLGMLVAPQAHGEGLVSKIFILIEVLCSCCLCLNLFNKPFLPLNHSWLLSANSKNQPLCRWASQEFEMAEKSQPMRLVLMTHLILNLYSTF